MKGGATAVAAGSDEGDGGDGLCIVKVLIMMVIYLPQVFHLLPALVAWAHTKNIFDRV